MHLFEFLNDEEFPVICSSFEGRFHSIDVIAMQMWPFSVTRNDELHVHKLITDVK